MSQKEYLVTINVSPSIEESVVDCLLTIENALGFTSFHVNTHDHRNHGLSIAEQVSGRQRKIQFQMYVNESVLGTLISRLKDEFSGSGIRYWIAPIFDQGEI